ncbi:MAG: DUF2225 domain-containing protein [Planctomycetes bacterium]|nr:DUF2225 domain-containing protein [Planctomycetota bacterium]
MLGTRWLAFCGLFWLAAVAIAPAASVREKPATCPYCAFAFQGLEVVAEDFKAGPPDPDLFVRPMSGAPREFFTVWTCPKCYFSALATDYAQALTEDDKKRLAPQLKELRWLRPQGMAEEPTSQIRIPAWFKHKAMYLCYVALGKPQWILGNAALRGCWVARVYHDPIDRDRALAQTYAEMTKAFEQRHQKEIGEQRAFALYRLHLFHGRLFLDDLRNGRFTEEEKPLAAFIGACFLREGGEHGSAVGPLNEVLSHPRASSVLKELASSELFLQKVEEEFQRLALQHFEKALADNEIPDEERRAFCTYLVGELHRRLGRPADAAAWFDKALANANTPKSIQDWAKAQRQLVSGGK